MKYHFYRQFFPSYKSHKTHKHYTFQDIQALDPSMGRRLAAAAKDFGYHANFF
eukprot:gene10830-7704_t